MRLGPKVSINSSSKAPSTAQRRRGGKQLAATNATSRTDSASRLKESVHTVGDHAQKVHERLPSPWQASMEQGVPCRSAAFPAFRPTSLQKPHVRTLTHISSQRPPCPIIRTLRQHVGQESNHPSSALGKNEPLLE